MKCNAPKSWFALPQKERDAIVSYCRKVSQGSILEDESEMQITWMKMCCIILSNMGMDEDRLFEFIGSWKSMYRKNSKIKTAEEQRAFLDSEMNRIFRQNGFPEDFVQSLKRV